MASCACRCARNRPKHAAACSNAHGDTGAHSGSQGHRVTGYDVTGPQALRTEVGFRFESELVFSSPCIEIPDPCFVTLVSRVDWSLVANLSPLANLGGSIRRGVWQAAEHICRSGTRARALRRKQRKRKQARNPQGCDVLTHDSKQRRETKGSLCSPKVKSFASSAHVFKFLVHKEVAVLKHGNHAVVGWVAVLHRFVGRLAILFKREAPLLGLLAPAKSSTNAKRGCNLFILDCLAPF